MRPFQGGKQARIRDSKLQTLTLKRSCSTFSHLKSVGHTVSHRLVGGQCPVHLPGQNIFCPGQNIFCPGQNFFVPDKIIFVPDKITFVPGLKAHICLGKGQKISFSFHKQIYFFRLGKSFVRTKNVQSRTKNILSGQMDGALD